MGGFTCCVPGCYKNSLKHKGTSFHVFPKDTKLRQKWVRQINRVGQRGKFSQFVPTTGHKVCGDHFEGGRKSYMVRPGDATHSQQPDSPAPSHEASCDDGLTNSTGEEPVEVQQDLFAEHSYAYDKGDEPLRQQLEDSKKSNGETMKFCNTLQQKNRCLKLELSCTYNQLKEARNRKENEFNYDALVKDEKRLKYYTGFKTQMLLETFWSLLEEDVNSLQFWKMKETTNQDRKFVLDMKTQLILVLMRLRLGLDGEDLAYRFGVSTSTVSRIWITWLDFLNNKLRQVPIWMPSQLCDKYRPQVFLAKGYDTVDGIMDCTEIFIETPSSFRVQSETFSNYKKHNTAKGLIVCSPNGFVVFVSDLAPGRLSDKALTNSCNVLDKFSPGRSIMADRGFTIQDECKARSLHLNIPPFMDGRPQLSEKDEEETRRIASVRIHVERVIRRVKTFKILSHVFPNSMADQLNKIWHICARLTNFVDTPLL
ncbi:uncharacterized protein LOC125947205 [Dermacentor silvarum]|uniref:uncharacterized protein LOC125947205 n=1 Tax=Dermacentor silvarum TaxID=543639 RepID=UPI00210068D0|nr:uncharacterized protein LOC125947205 [Dermacentor silvarum]